MTTELILLRYNSKVTTYNLFCQCRHVKRDLVAFMKQLLFVSVAAAEQQTMETHFLVHLPKEGS